MIASHHEHHGFAFAYRSDEMIGSSRVVWVVLHDASRLAEHVDLGDEWFVSLGLFVPSPQAMSIVTQFKIDGQRSSHVDWVRSCELPDYATY